MAAPIVMPSFGMYTADGKLAAWMRASGEPVAEGEPVLEIETDKAVHDVPAPAAGILHHVLPVGSKLTEQIIIGYVLADGEAPPAAEASPPPAPASREEAEAPAQPEEATGWIKASPLARRRARELGVSLAGLRGTGPGGRIVDADVQAAASRVPSPWRIRSRAPLAGLRRAIGERLKQSQHAAVALTLTREVRAKPLIEARSELNQRLGESVPFDAFFVKFLALALRELPELNAVISGDEVLVLDDVHVGFACAVQGGLVVPVVRDADVLDVAGIGRRIRDLAGRARAGQLKAGDFEGGVTTLTNLGGFGVDAFTPILNPPQSSILGIGRILERVVAEDGIPKVAPTVWLSLTFDHRVTDGAPAAQLLDAIARQMNDERGLRALAEA